MGIAHLLEETSDEHPKIKLVSYESIFFSRLKAMHPRFKIFKVPFLDSDLFITTGKVDLRFYDYGWTR